jgi:hypothetical protein
VQKLLAQLTRTTRPGRAAAVAELLAREPNADAALRVEARRNDYDLRRIAALQVLLRRSEGQQDPVRFVLRTTIFDRDPEVRAAAARLAVAGGHATDATVCYLAPGLLHEYAVVRERTAEAFAALGNPLAIEFLVMAGPLARTARVPAGAPGNRGARGHIAILNQQAYIRDFDVEVAQASFIADPKVDVLQSGAVLDVTVTGVYEERVLTRLVTTYRGALRRLAKDAPVPSDDPEQWAEWHRQLRAQQAAAAETPARG